MISALSRCACATLFTLLVTQAFIMVPAAAVLSGANDKRHDDSAFVEISDFLKGVGSSQLGLPLIYLLLPPPPPFYLLLHHTVLMIE